MPVPGFRGKPDIVCSNLISIAFPVPATAVYTMTAPVVLNRSLSPPCLRKRWSSCVWKMKNNTLVDLLDRLSDLPILVIGDLILDEFIWGKVDRISPGAPVPVVEVTHESVRLGGAANVAVNLASLQARPMLVGAVGSDEKG